MGISFSFGVSCSKRMPWRLFRACVPTCIYIPAPCAEGRAVASDLLLQAPPGSKEASSGQLSGGSTLFFCGNFGIIVFGLMDPATRKRVLGLLRKMTEVSAKRHPCSRSQRRHHTRSILPQNVRVSFAVCCAPRHLLPMRFGEEQVRALSLICVRIPPVWSNGRVLVVTGCGVRGGRSFFRCEHGRVSSIGELSSL